MNRRARALLAAAVLLLMVGCGSTVQVRSTTATGGASGLDGVGSPVDSPRSLDASPSTRAGGRGLAPSTAGAGAQPGAGAVSPGRLAPRPGTSGGTGVASAKAPVKIGVYVATAASNYYSQLGLEGLSTGDQINQVKAITAYINAHGGMGGRPIQLVFHDFDIARGSSNPSSEAQAACSTFTQDHHVFAVVSILGNADMGLLFSCLRDHGVIGISTATYVDAGFMKRMGDYFYAPSTFMLERAVRTNIEVLHARGFFDPKAPVGVVAYTSQADQAVLRNGILPTLAKFGLKADVYNVDVEGSGAEYPNMVLKFRQNGVKQVVFTWTSVLLFAQAAQAQNYHAAFALTSYSYLQFLQSNAPASQLEGAMGIGWNPIGDVDGARDPGPVSSRAALCTKIARDAGEDVGQRSVVGIVHSFCDSLFFLADASKGAAQLDVRSFATSAQALGRGFESAYTFSSLLAPGRLNDGASSYRLFSFRNDCSCFAYVGPRTPVR